MRAQRAVAVFFSIILSVSAQAQSLSQEVTVWAQSNYRVDVFGHVQYYDENGEQAAELISGDLTLFDGPFQYDTPYQSDWTMFYDDSGTVSPEIRYDGIAGWCYNATIRAQTRDLPLLPSFGNPDCTPPYNPFPREPHGYDLCPLLLDLDGGGIETSSVTNPVLFFDSDRDGRLERSAWTSGRQDDAFLWIDVNANGEAEAGELLGSSMLLPTGEVARNGFQALAVHDQPGFGGDGNGVIDRRDEVWDRLRLWIDRNHDAHSQPGEVSTLGAEKIIELSLERQRTHIIDGNGNSLMLLGSFTKRVLEHGRKSVTVQRQLVDIAFVPVEE